MVFENPGVWYGVGGGGWQGPKEVSEAPVGNDLLEVPPLVSSDLFT